MMGKNANSYVFDFTCYYKMNTVFNGSNLNLLRDAILGTKPLQSSHFCYKTRRS